MKNIMTNNINKQAVATTNSNSKIDYSDDLVEIFT